MEDSGYNLLKSTEPDQKKSPPLLSVEETDDELQIKNKKEVDQTSATGKGFISGAITREKFSPKHGKVTTENSNRSSQRKFSYFIL